MRIISKILTTIILAISTAPSSEPDNYDSMFLNQESSEKILQFLNTPTPIKSENDQSSANKKDFKLDGILFVCDDNWCVWINSEAYKTCGQHQGFSIDEVTPEEVTITLDNGNTKIMKTNYGE